MSQSQFTVKTNDFEGPLDLLLSLIEKRKLFINDISLSKVADDYIEHVNKMGELPVGMTAHFILVASTLILIKSRSLLPSIQLSQEEESSIEDLEHRLKLYKKFKELSLGIQKKFGTKIIFPKSSGPNIPIIFSPDKEITTKSILEAVKQTISNLPQKESLPKTVVEKIISLEEMIKSLTERISSDLKMNFSDFTKKHGSASGSKHKTVSREEKKNIIVSFLALLELVKQGILEARQEKVEEDIHIETQSLTLPKYT